MSFSSTNSTAQQVAFRSQSDSVLLDENVHLMEQTFRLLPDIVSVYDVDSQQIVYSNRTFASVLGYVDGSATDDDLLHPDDAASMNAQLQQTLALNDEDCGDIAYRLKHADGSWKWFSERQVIFKRRVDGTVARILKTARFDMGIARNITQQMEKITVDLSMEREQSHLLSQFINSISHELRTPLAVIKTSLYLIKKTNDPIKQEERLQLIEHQTAQLARLIEQMGMLLRVDSLHEAPAATPITLNKMMANLQEEYASALAKKEITLELRLDDRLPKIEVDYDLLLVALQNILENAIAYTDAGGITAYTTTQNNEVIVTVEDSGNGIDAEHMPHLFERFYSVGANKQRNTIAAGLGLIITQRIMELSRGRIEVESQLGRGSRFRLIWPVKP
ncbi:MAG: PAS domain-containing protein [Anaerolineae bacterium]|nr:PAS domain-containing protein [Anaerolineae bacterium]